MSLNVDRNCTFN